MVVLRGLTTSTDPFVTLLPVMAATHGAEFHAVRHSQIHFAQFFWTQIHYMKFILYMLVRTDRV